MKQFKNSLKTIFVMATIIVSSCGKDKTTTNTNSTNNNNTNPIATLGSVIHHGKTFPVVTVDCYGKYNEKSYFLRADLSNADSLIYLYISTADYLPTSATKTLTNNIMPLANGNVSWIMVYYNKTTFIQHQESSVQDKSGNITITNSNNEIQYVTNNSQGYDMGANLGGKMSFNIKRTNPTLPSAFANYIIPSGLDANNITIGATTWSHTSDRHVIASDNGKCKALVQYTGSGAKELDFYFINGLPLSGTYDVVTSESAVTDGKVFIKYTNTSPIQVLSSSNTAQKIVVENINGVVKIYAQNITLGTENLNAFVTF